MTGRNVHELPRGERNPRRHADRLGRADHDGGRARPARRRVPADQGRQVSGPPELRPVRQVAAFRGRLQDRVDAHGGNASRRDRGLDQQVPELGSVRPGEMGAGRLRLRARRLARLRPLARLRRALVAARGEGFRAVHRVGGNAEVVERQGRPERHLLLRDEPVAGRVPAAEAPHRDVHLGRRGRLLPRSQPPRRHLLHVCAELVRHAGQDHPVRPRHARPSQPHERRLGLGTGNADLGGDGQQPLRSRTRPISSTRSTTSTGRR